MKRIILFFLLLSTSVVYGQQISLEECFRLARENFPLIKKQKLIHSSTRYSLDNASKAYLPQLSVNGQATYQSDVTKIPLNMPGIPELSKDQYRLQGEIAQVIYDGGVIHNQKEILKAEEAIQVQQVEVSLQALKERINQIYFSILLFNNQLQQQQLYRKNISTMLDKATAALQNGTNYKSNVNELKAELIKTDMNTAEIKSDRKGFLHMLSLFIGTPLDENTTLQIPAFILTTDSIKRTELILIDLQKKSIDLREKKLNTDWAPKIAAFAQGGYGRPGLNMLDNSFKPFALGGIKLNIPIGSLYTLKNNKRIMEINRAQLEADRENFLLNTRASLTREQEAIQKYTHLLKQDDEVIKLRQEVSQSAKAQLENGVITTHEYINQVNAENLAIQLKNLHQVQLLNAQMNYQTISGN